MVHVTKCFQMLVDPSLVFGSAFDVFAWSRLQLGLSFFWWWCSTNSLLELPSICNLQAILFQLQCCHVIRIFVSYKPMKSAQTYVIQTCTERHLMLILSLLDFLQNRRLELIQAKLDFQRDNTVCSWLCDECSWWDVLIEDRMLGSTLWLIWPSDYPTISKSSWFYVVIVQTRCGNLMKLVNRPVRQIAIELDTQLGASPSISQLQAVTLFRFSNGFWHLCLFWSPPRTISVCPSHHCYSLVLLVDYIQEKLDQWMILGRPSRFSFAMLATSLACSEFFLLSLCRQFSLARIIASCAESTSTPIRELFSHPSSTFIPMRLQPKGDREDCPPAVPMDRWLSPNVVVFLLSVFWSESLDNPLPKDEEVLVRLSFWLACMRSRHHLLVQNSQVILK